MKSVENHPELDTFAAKCTLMNSAIVRSQSLNIVIAFVRYVPALV